MNVSNVSSKIMFSVRIAMCLLPSQTAFHTREVVSEGKEGKSHMLEKEFFKKGK